MAKKICLISRHQTDVAESCPHTSCQALRWAHHVTIFCAGIGRGAGSGETSLRPSSFAGEYECHVLSCAHLNCLCCAGDEIERLACVGVYAPLCFSYERRSRLPANGMLRACECLLSATSTHHPFVVMQGVDSASAMGKGAIRHVETVNGSITVSWRREKT